MTGRGDRDEMLALEVCERIGRAQEMLGRLGSRAVYEPNYAVDKLADAAQRALEACAVLGMSERDIRQLAGDASDHGARVRTRIRGPVDQ